MSHAPLVRRAVYLVACFAPIWALVTVFFDGI